MRVTESSGRRRHSSSTQHTPAMPPPMTTCFMGVSWECVQLTKGVGILGCNAQDTVQHQVQQHPHGRLHRKSHATVTGLSEGPLFLCAHCAGQRLHYK